MNKSSIFFTAIIFGPSEIVWFIPCLTSKCSILLMSGRYLVSQGCIKPLCDLLICPDPRIVTVCLEGLENILKVGEAEKNMGNADANLFAQLIDYAEGIDKIENLQSHDNNEIYEKAVKILETYWVEDDEEPLPPGDAAPSSFNFGGNEPSVPSGGFNFS